MAKSKRGGKAYVSGYSRYKTGNVEANNRKRKLLKVMAKQPNNEQIPAAITNIRHRRNTPKTPFWSHSMIAIAKLIKYYTGKFDKNMFSSDPVIFAAATRTRNENKFKNLNITSPKGSMFAIGERVWK